MAKLSLALSAYDDRHGQYRANSESQDFRGRVVVTCNHAHTHARKKPMNAIIALLACLAPYLSSTTLSQLSRLIFALLVIPSRVTTLGLSRWTEDGGSCRTLQRWYQTPVEWATVLWVAVRTHLLKPNGVYLLAGE
jgi:hypothetical protein